jgi:DNA-binding transcriptional MerR regulator
MKKIADQEMLKISELAKAAGVSSSTIHYYMQEGLLTPPTRTSRNMAYYLPQCVQEIRLIQELQTKQYLPLSAIKMLIQARQDGQAAGHLVEMRSLVENIFRPLDNETPTRNFSLAELATASELPAATLTNLESLGLIIPHPESGGMRYDEIDLKIAKLVRRWLQIGFQMTDLGVFRPYLEVVRLQTRTLHEMLHRLPDHDHIPVNELLNLIKELKSCLDLKIFRAEARQFGEHRPHQGDQHVIPPPGP